jgi:hypothetical protein
LSRAQSSAALIVRVIAQGQGTATAEQLILDAYSHVRPEHSEDGGTHD